MTVSLEEIDSVTKTRMLSIKGFDTCTNETDDIKRIPGKPGHLHELSSSFQPQICTSFFSSPQLISSFSRFCTDLPHFGIHAPRSPLFRIHRGNVLFELPPHVVFRLVPPSLYLHQDFFCSIFFISCSPQMPQFFVQQLSGLIVQFFQRRAVNLFAMTTIYDSLLELSLQLFTHVFFVSLVANHCILGPRNPICRGNSELRHPRQSVSFALVPRVPPPVDQLALFLVMARFTTARFCLTLDLVLRIEGNEDGEIEARIIPLETKGRSPCQIFIHVHSSERSSSLSPS